jgi:hypothetical protein
MKHTPFTETVFSPWKPWPNIPVQHFHPNNTVYDDGEYGISQLPDNSFLYFKRVNGNCCAFTNRVGLSLAIIGDVKAVLAGSKPDNYLTERAFETIRNWEEA